MPNPLAEMELLSGMLEESDFKYLVLIACVKYWEKIPYGQFSETLEISEEKSILQIL